MKKSFLTFITLLLVILLLVACGGNQQPTSTSSETENSSTKSETTSTEIDFPKKPITLIVSFSAGGGTDLGARLLASYIEEDLGVPVNVLNKPGGGGWVGWTDLANAKPDGYTIGYLNTPNLITGYMNPELERKHNLESFITIANHMTDPGVIAIRADDERFSTLAELIEYAKENELTTTSTGVASDDHTAVLKVNNELGTKFKAVHAAGFPENKANVLGGHVDVFFANVGELVGDHEDGTVKILAVLGEERSPFLPDVPTMVEEGFGSIYSWSARGIGAPAGMDPEILAILEAAFEKAITDPEQAKKMDAMWLKVDYRNSEDYMEMLQKEAVDLQDLKDILGW
ncbi:tripartite tricarboxylate transporter substrate binding protein [bacterium LRH843]|nr:tripartite tricarboxylate transporter substrate binding protein [bacterium LRH843]